MSRCKLKTPWPIHFKLRTVIGIDSLTVYILFGEIKNFHSRVMGKKIFTNIVWMLTTGVSRALGAAVYFVLLHKMCIKKQYFFWSNIIYLHPSDNKEYHTLRHYYPEIWFWNKFMLNTSRSGCDRIVVEFTTSYAISAYHH